MSNFLGEPDEITKAILDIAQSNGGGVKTVPMPSNKEVIAQQEEWIQKDVASNSRAMAFERRKRLPYLIQKGLSKPGRISFDVLRRASRSVAVARICINVLKEKVAKTQWVIQSKDPKVKVDDAKIKKLTEFFMNPNTNNETFRTFLDKSLEDLLVLDAVAWEKTRYPDGTLAELHYVDSATIRPIFDEHGNQDVILPFAEEESRNGDEEKYLPVSYVQVVDDNPWGGREAGQPVAFWPKKDFVYFNMFPQGDLASFGYGMSPIESVIGVVSNILAADNFNSTYFEEGAFPPMLLQFKAKMGTRELEQLREYLRTELEGRFYRPAILAGQEDITPIPLKDITQRDMQFMQYTDFMARLLASAYGLKAQDIGITDGENRATAVTQKQQMEQQGYGSVLALLKEVFNQQIIWKDFGMTDLEFDWVLTDDLAPDIAATVYDTGLKNGTMTLNEVRKKIGMLPFEEWADKPAILTGEGYKNIDPDDVMVNDAIPGAEDSRPTAEGHDSNPNGETAFRDEHEDEKMEGSKPDMNEAQEVSKSIITRDGVFRCWQDDRGVGQPFIFANVLTGQGFALKPPVAVNLDSQKLEEVWTHKLAKDGLNVVPVTRMTETQIWDDIIPNNMVKKEFQNYQNMTPEYDSEKWRAKFGGSRKFPYYSVSRYVDGRSLIDPLLIADMKRVPDDYIQAVKDLAKVWLAEKKYVLGDRRADQVIITPNKRAWAFDFQFVGNESRWKGTKDAYAIALKSVPQLHDLFVSLTGQEKKEATLKSMVDRLLNKLK